MSAPCDSLAKEFEGVVSGAPARPTPTQLNTCEKNLTVKFAKAGYTTEQALEKVSIASLLTARSRWWTTSTVSHFRHAIGAELVNRFGWHRKLHDAIHQLNGLNLLLRTVELDQAWRDHELQLNDVLRAWKRGRYLLADNDLAIGFQKTAKLMRGPFAPESRSSLPCATLDALMEWRHRVPLLARLSLWGLSKEDAQDIHQQLTLEFLGNGLAGFDPSKNTFGAYLCGAAWKKRQDFHRRAARRGRLLPLDSVPDPNARPDRETDRMEAREFLDVAMAQLAAGNRLQYEAVKMRSEGFTTQEIATAQNCPIGTAGVRNKRGFDNLRLICEDILDKRGDTVREPHR